MTAVLERPGAPAQRPPARPWRWRLAARIMAALVAVVLAAGLTYMANLEPLTDAGSDSVGALGTGEVHRISPPLSETVYLARYRPGDRLGVVFALQNASRLPVRLKKIWSQRPLDCGWAPTERHLHTGLNYQSTDAPRIPFDSYTLRPGESVAVELRGAFRGDSDCHVPGIVSPNHVVIETSILGLPRRHAYELPYEFGWSSDPERALQGIFD